MTDETPNPTTPDGQPDATPDARPDAADDATPGVRPDAGPVPAPDDQPGAAPDDPPGAVPPDARPSSATDGRAHRPEYKGAELDPERGPGLGCFWFQLIVLGFFIVLIPIGLKLAWPYELLAVLLFVVIGLLLLTGQSVIFLLRLVAADRRAQGRRRPLASPTKTVGEIEDEHRVAHAVGGARPAEPPPAAGPSPAADPPTQPTPEVLPAVPETPPVGIDGAAPEATVAATSVDGGEGAVPPPEPAGAAERSAPPTPGSLTDRRQAGSELGGAGPDESDRTPGEPDSGPDESDRTPEEPDRTPDEPLSETLGRAPEEPDPGVPQ